MKENKLAELSMEFSVDIINIVKHLKSNHESIISNQIGRSGTSIGANIHEAQYAQGKKDFVSKLEIALKEASKSHTRLGMAFLLLIHLAQKEKDGGDRYDNGIDKNREDMKKYP